MLCIQQSCGSMCGLFTSAAMCSTSFPSVCENQHNGTFVNVSLTLLFAN